MKHVRARSKRDSRGLDAEEIRRVVLPLFRRRNDYSRRSLDELPAELRRFDIVTRKDLRRLMKRHRRSLLTDEKIRMTRTRALGLRDEWGGAGVDTFSGTAWFSVPGLVREAMEREFGEAAAIYAVDAQA